MTASGTHFVSGPQALADFRQGLTGQYAMRLLEEANGRVLITLPVGVGKTRFMLSIIRQVRAGGSPYDLVIVLVPRRDLLREIDSQLRLSPSKLVLHPRPQRSCGPLNDQWLEFERNDCGALARAELCSVCRHRAVCQWLTRYTPERMARTRLILATQQHLVNDPNFIARVQQLAGARRPLVLLDESDLLIRPSRRVLSHTALTQFIEAQELTLAETARPTPAQERWLELSRQIATADTPALQTCDLTSPAVTNVWARQVQTLGRRLFGGAFRFAAYDLISLSRSHVLSREKTMSGDIECANPPQLGDAFIVFSGTVARGLARFRLDPNDSASALLSPFQHHSFEHPGTRWFNIRSFAASHNNWPGNRTVILDFFAEKIARNIRAGRRTLLVAKKRFVADCANYLNSRLLQLGVEDVHFVTSDWRRANLRDPGTLPIVNYGISGVNLFEDFDCVYCLTGYYVPAAVISDAVQDLVPSNHRVSLDIEIQSEPTRRIVRVDSPDAVDTRLPQLANWVLEQKEADVVIQAVGRVRPFTRPREVITFHYGCLPNVRYTLEFETLRQARSHFGIATRRVTDFELRAREIKRLKQRALTNEVIARLMGVSVRTVRRHLRKARGQRD